MASDFVRRLLAHPLTSSLHVDDPATTELRKQIITSKPFLKAIYDEWYTMFARELPLGEGLAVELGSGGGYAAQLLPGLITSDVFVSVGIQVMCNAQAMPFADGTLRAIVMTNVLHHIPKVSLFFAEATRCLRPEGKILMIEPWALPWIVFSRDQKRFQEEFPKLRIECVRPFLPFRYLVSGGVGMRSLMPGFTHAAWASLEHLLESQMGRIAMFAFLAVRRV